MRETRLLPETLPLFPLGGAILLPGAQLPLNVFEPRYLNMVDDVRREGGHIGIIQIRDGGTPERPHLAPVGCAGRLEQFEETRDGRYLINLVGVSRFRLAAEEDSAAPYRIARPDYAPYRADLQPPAELGGDRKRLVALLQAWFSAEHISTDWAALTRAPLADIVDQLAVGAPFSASERQAMLEAEDAETRLLVMEETLAERLAGSADGPLQ